ncbi:hypothetical protein EDD21DRAFT_357868 [Dissophora ornata]|nr:hypothetical protein EDD21DRAFT_357868 [Dissophora ornata]
MDPERHYIKRCTSASQDFFNFIEVFQFKLESLYTIEYSMTVKQRLHSGRWKNYYYHFVGPCKCLRRWTMSPMKDDYSEIESITWCCEPHCPVQPILNHGSLLSYLSKCRDPSPAVHFE